MGESSDLIDDEDKKKIKRNAIMALIIFIVLAAIIIGNFNSKHNDICDHCSRKATYSYPYELCDTHYYEYLKKAYD